MKGTAETRSGPDPLSSQRRKLEGWELLYTVLKGEKVGYRYIILHLYANNFFCRNFFTLFSTDLKSASNSVIFYTRIKMLYKKYFRGHSNIFHKLWSPTRTKRLKKLKKTLFETWIRINYIFQFWFRTSKVLKSFHSNGHIEKQVFLLKIWKKSYPKFLFWPLERTPEGRKKIFETVAGKALLHIFFKIFSFHVLGYLNSFF